MKKIMVLLAVWLVTSLTFAAKVGDWNLYLSYHNALACQPAGNEIFAIFDGNLLNYHPEDEEVRCLSKLDGLNGKNIQLMGYSESEKCLVLVYDDFQIDLMYTQDGSIMSLPQIKNSGVEGQKAHRLFVDGEHAVLAVSNGVIFLNLKKQEIVGYYVLDMDVKTAAIYNDVLYAAGESELFASSITGNPLDRSEWTPICKASFDRLVICGNHLYGFVGQTVENGLAAGMWIAKEDGRSFRQLTDKVYTNVYADAKKLVVANSSSIQVYDGSAPESVECNIKYDNQWKNLSRSADGIFWVAEGYNGVQAYRVEDETLVAEGEPIGNYGPRRDLCYYMRYVGERLLIAGGRLDPYDQVHYPGTLMEYTQGVWKYFQEDSISVKTGVKYRDITSVAVDPEDPDHVMASAGGTGMYEFRNYKYVNHYSVHNSPLMSAAGTSPYYVRVDGLNYDNKGNLWIVNTISQDTLLRTLRPDGTWGAIYIEAIKNAPTCEKTMFDRKGRLWLASRRTVDHPRHDAGLLCLDYNGTVDNLNDDVSTYRTTFVNQDGKSYFLGGVYCMAEDLDGSIWVGTKLGLFVIANPDDWHKPDFRVIQIKVPRNDGTNLADYLLSDIPISAIAIDGAGRKWIGTESNGLYLVSEDGLKVIEHFEEKNSPLLSNYIYSIAPNLQTGEVMIGTDKGLCSYQSEATMPETSLDKHNIKVYPNPVRPDYHGNVKVVGLTENAEIKIMTTNGEVVAVGNSTGGTFVWDARGGDGSRVAPGVYYLMIATSDGKKGIASKIVVI